MVKLELFRMKTKVSCGVNPMTEEFSRGKPQLKVATMGHAGHGKTTLTAAINQVLSMKGRAKKEGKLQGIDVHHSAYESDKRIYEHIDAPTELFSSTATSAARLDGGILVVSVADGPMPDTREHILHAKQVGVPCIVVFLNKSDMIGDKELIELIDMEVRELLSLCGFAGDDAVPSFTERLRDLFGRKRQE